MTAQPVPILLMVRELGIGGCERDLTKLAKHIDRSKFSPHVGCFLSEGLRTSELRAAGVPIVQFPVTSFRSPSAIRGARAMGRYLAEHRIQLVHCFDTPTVIFGIPTAHFYETPAVISAQLGERELFSYPYPRLLRWTDGFADVVVSNSKAIQDYLIAKEKVPAERTYLCYNGVQTEVFHPDPDEPRQDIVKDAPLVIGTLCALRPEKRLDILIRAFAQTRHLTPGAKLLIVGSGPMLPQLEALRDELSLGGDCLFVPAQTTVPPWLRSLDIYVISSETESFPNALLEAMATGRAVIGTRVGGIPELIAEGESGLLFERNDVGSLSAALSKLMTDPAMRRRFASAAAETASTKFSMDVNARRNEALYTSVLRRKGITVP